MRRIRRRLTGFYDTRDEWRVLVEPDGPPSGAQVGKLNSLGMLELVDLDEAEPLPKAEAAGAISEVSP